MISISNANGNLYGSGSSKNNVAKQRKSHKGYYKLGFVEPYERMTERDIELRQEYAKDLIGKYTGLPKDLIQFKKKSTNQTILSLDEVFYVKTGIEPIGKVSIRVQRLFKTVSLTIIYQEKRLSGDTTYSRDAQGNFKRKSQSAKRKASRKRKKDTRKF